MAPDMMKARDPDLALVLAALSDAREHWRAGRIDSAREAYGTVIRYDRNGDRAAEAARFFNALEDWAAARELLAPMEAQRPLRNVEMLLLIEAEWALGEVDVAHQRYRAYFPQLMLDAAELKQLFRLPGEIQDPDPKPAIVEAISRVSQFKHRAGIRLFQIFRQAGLLDLADLVLSRTEPRDPNEPVTALGISVPMHIAKLNLARAQRKHAEVNLLEVSFVPPTEIMEKLGDGSLDWRMRAAEANKKVVPRIIHQIWVGSRPVPVTVDVWRSYSKKLGYEYYLWQEKDLERIGVYENRPFNDFMSKRSYAAAVDVARYIVMEKFGGIYLDCDFIPCTDTYSLHDILPMIGYSALSAKACRQIGKSGFFVLNGFIASPPRHPVFSTAIDGLEAALKLLPKSPPWWIPGPAYLTAISKGSVTVISPSIWVGAGKAEKSLDEILQLAKVAAESKGAALMGWKPWRTSSI